METGVIGDLIQWAEFIFLMETSHKIKIVKKFRELPITYYLLPITYYLLPITYYLLPITYYLLPITYYLLPINKKHVRLDIPDNDHRMGLALVSMLE